jgi:DNA-binding LacI/PurR family transcriptional regulator
MIRRANSFLTDQYCYYPLLLSRREIAFSCRPVGATLPRPLRSSFLSTELSEFPSLVTVKSSLDLVTKGREPAHRRIFRELRDQIQSGKYAPGSRLPGTKELASQWRASVFTLHTALHALAKEGWIDRRPRAGTYIADPRSRFLCAGIYHTSDITGASPFIRTVHFSLMERLERLKKDAQVFNDSRPPERQEQVFLPLAEAILQRRIQCLIAPTINPVDAPALARLSIPTAFFANSVSENRIDFDKRDFFRGSARYLAANGCRSAGLISNVAPTTNEQSPYRTFYPDYHEALKGHGLATQSEWLSAPNQPPQTLAVHGYKEFKNLWSQPNKPDGLIVYPDAVAQGVVIAILELGIQVVPPRMKFVFHRNAHLDVLCPFPVMWGISDENLLADGLIQIIQKQFAGEEVSPVSLPFEFREE